MKVVACLRLATMMLLPPRTRPRMFPRTLVKTSLLALGVLVWLLYFYSNSSNSYEAASRPPGGDAAKRAAGFILRRPTVPLFEGIAEANCSTDDVPSADPSDADPPLKEVRRGGYAVLENLLVGRLRFGYNQSVTITTHATYELLDNLIYLSQRWAGPISVAVYAPRDDFKTALLYALWLRRCHKTVADYVTFHFVYPAPSGDQRVSSEHSPLKMKPKSSKGSQNSTESSNGSQNLPEVIKQSVTSPEASSVPKAAKVSAPNEIQDTHDQQSMRINVTINPPGSSPRGFQNSPKLQHSLHASKPLPKSPNLPESSSKALHPSLRGPAPFQEPVTSYDHLARDIVSRFTNDSSGPPCSSTSFPLPRSYRHRNHLPYPINVCRNVARLNAGTHYVLASDIELYPSTGVVPMFLELSRREGLVQEPGWEATTAPSFFAAPGPAARRVFVLPIFEVDQSVGAVPSTKAALVELYRRKKAVYFHKHVCSFCNIIPRLNRWLVAPVPRGRLGLFMTIKRHKPFNRWEPIYIGTNSEPLYDERLTWEGQQDKMTQMYELCLMNYDLAILDNAFLVHRPGIKSKNATEYKLKSPFIAQNNKIYKNIIQDMEKKHGTNAYCK